MNGFLLEALLKISALPLNQPKRALMCVVFNRQAPWMNPKIILKKLLPIKKVSKLD